MKKYIYASVITLIMTVQILSAGFVSANDTYHLPQVFAGVTHSVAIDAKRNLWVWGDNYYGQIGNGEVTKYNNDNQITDNKDVYTPIKIMSDVIWASAGRGYTLAITKDHTLYAWGKNDYGQLGDGSRQNKATPTRVMEDVLYAEAGMNTSIAIKKDHSLYIWGQDIGNSYNYGEDSVIHITKIFDNVQKASIGNDHLMILANNGNLLMIGTVSYLGNNDTTPNKKTNIPVQIMTDIADISAGFQQSFAIDKNGDLFAWGANGNDGNLGIGTSEFWVYTPQFVTGNVKTVSGKGNMLIKKNDSLWIWGTAENIVNYRCAEGTDVGGVVISDIISYGWKPIMELDNIVSASGNNHYLAVNKDGDLFTWGTNLYGELGNGKNSVVDKNVIVLYEDYTEEEYYFTEDNQSYMPSIIKNINVSAKEDIKVMLNNQLIPFDQPPILENGRTLVPMRAIFEAMGAMIVWNENAQSITATKDDITINMTINQSIITKNGQKITLDVPPKLINSRTLVPVRAVAEGLNADVTWDDNAQTVIITSE